MGFREWLEDNPKRDERRIRSPWRLVTAWIVALTIAAIILIAFRQGTASADEPYPGEERPQVTCVSLGQFNSGEFVTRLHSPAARLDSALDSPRDMSFWRASDSTQTKDCAENTIGSKTMLGGVASDSTTRQPGFTPTMTPNGNDQDNTGSRQ